MATENEIHLLPIGTLLRGGTYRIESYLGSGGFGNTYLVRHLGLDAEMVLKEFFMKGINLRMEDRTVTVSVPDNHATFESQRAKFKKEAQRLWTLKCEHIVGVHDIFEENGTVYYSMDYIHGESLSDRLRQKEGPFSESEVRDILLQLLDALCSIHTYQPQPLFHLDIKPNNILLDSNGRVVLIDFGASKQLSSSHEGVTSTLMTYARGYSPMEQIDGKTDLIGAWTDIYALGATLYRLLTYRQPPEPSEIFNEGEDAFHFPATVSTQMRQLILWMMQPSRKKRPQSVKEVRNFLSGNFNSDIEKYSFSETTILDATPPQNHQVAQHGKKLLLQKKPWIVSQNIMWVLCSVFIVLFIIGVIYKCNGYREKNAGTAPYVDVVDYAAEEVISPAGRDEIVISDSADVEVVAE